MGTWRQHYAPKIKAIIDEETEKGKTVKEIRRVLYKANPGYYGHMKKIWSDESLKQLGLKKRKVIGRKANHKSEDPNQTSLL